MALFIAALFAALYVFCLHLAALPQAPAFALAGPLFAFAAFCAVLAYAGQKGGKA